MMKTNGGNPEYCFFTNPPPWRIWFITKASLDFIILALSSLADPTAFNPVNPVL